VQRVVPAGQKTSKSASELLKYRRFASRIAAGNNIDAYHQFTTPFFVTGSL